MSYTTPAIYMQRRTIGGTPPDPECAAYTRPAPTAVVTNLDVVPVIQTATAVVTNLCAEVS